MDAEDSRRSGYYQSIARAFLERRGAPFLLSPKDQAAIAGWEESKIPLRVVLEGIGRTFDGLKARGRGPKGISLAFCERQVDAAFAQHRDRAAGSRSGEAAARPRPDKRDKARREIEKALRGLGPGDGDLAGLLGTALEILAGPKPDDAALERIDAAVEDLLWSGVPAEARSAVEAEIRRELRGRRPKDIGGMARRKAVQAARADRRIPHASLYYY
jgi:hypothetical protein